MENIFEVTSQKKELSGMKTGEMANDCNNDETSERVEITLR